MRPCVIIPYGRNSESVLKLWTQKPMKSRTIFVAAALPLAYGLVIAFHPGIAYASQATKNGTPILKKTSGSYTIDPMHTSVGFEIEHLGLSRVQGRFEKVSGHIQADVQDISKSKVNFTIQSDSVNTSVAPRDADLRSPNFFDAATYPEINFVSTHVKKRGSGFVAEGELTMHGVTKTIAIPFKMNGPIKDPWGGVRAGIVAESILINREDYGMKSDVPMVGSEVTVRISLEGTLDKS
jgi:polyisoprenoid-binding protein YceI